MYDEVTLLNVDEYMEWSKKDGPNDQELMGLYMENVVMILCLISTPLCKFANDGDECLDLF